MSNLFHALNSSSRWHRWEPHIHAPGSVLNNQFRGADPWEAYLNALETATPTIRALGITDYYNTDLYEKVCKAKRDGRLPNCDLIFPNVEMRPAVGNIKARWVNIHLLVSPEEPEHLVELKRVLARLTFEAHDDSYCCSREDLIRLGQKVEPTLTHSAAALARGCEQFKVSFDQLRDAFKKNTWAQENIAVAVAGGEADGTSGVREGADQVLRAEVEKFAHVIFASSPAQRDFWLGRGVLPEAVIRERYNGLKPCLHGSDAHSNGTVGAPHGGRFSWIKGAVEFDTLRQACIDPGSRAFVGAEPPIQATPSQVIAGIQIVDAPWAQTKRIALNPGLVAIIGARGSGKTALADMIALGCDSTSDRLSEASFLVRARELLSGSGLQLTWATGEENERELDQSDEPFADDYPHARYLSQKFVEDLCSAQEMTDTLLEEIERVIFEAHPLADRDGTKGFQFSGWMLVCLKRSFVRRSVSGA